MGNLYNRNDAKVARLKSKKIVIFKENHREVRDGVVEKRGALVKSGVWR